MLDGCDVTIDRWLARLAIVALLILPLPALAASRDEIPLYVILPVALLFLGVPAAGLGFVLGSFCRLRTSVAIVFVLAIIPVVLVWTIRGPELAIQMAKIATVMLLLFSPLVALGWRLGRRDAKRHMAGSDLAYGNGK